MQNSLFAQAELENHTKLFDNLDLCATPNKLGGLKKVKMQLNRCSVCIYIINCQFMHNGYSDIMIHFNLVDCQSLKIY